MKEQIITCRNAIFHFLYTKILKEIFFLADPEKVHDFMTAVGAFLSQFSITRAMTFIMFHYSHPKLEQTVLGINFKNPVGLAAGFDKDALLTNILPDVGFGFEEVGSITGEPCEGNPKPRLWRLKKSKGLVVYYGLKNDGAEAISKRLTGKKFRFPIGISVAKTNSPQTIELQAGIDDYLKAYRAFKNIGDYYTINVSCPNAFGGEPFCEPERLEKLLAAVAGEGKTKPIFIKMASYLTPEVLDRTIELAEKYKIDGFICTNLSKDKEKQKNKIHPDDKAPEHGGISGKVVEEESNNTIKYIYQKTKGRFVIIGVGGIFTAEDAYKKIRLGATLLQLITGMIFEGPQNISAINQGLVKLLERDGYKNISEAVGADNK